MALRKGTGDMYEFITHTWNPIKGRCFHDCAYCYMKEHGFQLDELRLDLEEFKTDLGTDNFIFVGSGTDLFANGVPTEWIKRTLDYCNEFNNNLFGFGNKYLFQSKNPARILEFIQHTVFQHSIVCTTLESNRWYSDYMKYAPKIENRVIAIEELANLGVDTYVTIEPIMDFDLEEFVQLVKRCKPKQVNVGKNSKEDIIILPNPSEEKIMQLIEQLQKFTDVHLKKNLFRK